VTADTRQRRITSADVARESGLSRATVSYVLNDTPGQKIPEATRQRVREVAARLGYAPSAAARTLRAGRSDVVLALLPDWPVGTAVGAFLSDLSSALAEVGLTFLAHPRGRTGRPVDAVWKAITPAAVIAFEDLAEAEVATMRAAGVEVTVLLLGGRSRRRRELEIPEQRTGRVQAEHLAAAGHRRLGYALPADDRVRMFAGPRLDGVRLACTDLGLDEPVQHTVPLDPVPAAAAVTAWRAAGVTAVCAYNDEVGLAVLAGLRRLRLAAPADLAVVGVDDIPAAALAVPPLSTVLLDHRVLAEHLAVSITRSLAGRPAPPRPGSHVVRLIARESG
jgi:DNA-binding LacI/PurR family transcriptional regulator